LGGSQHWFVIVKLIRRFSVSVDVGLVDMFSGDVVHHPAFFGLLCGISRTFRFIFFHSSCGVSDFSERITVNPRQ
jgi:hypothetical protein